MNKYEKHARATLPKDHVFLGHGWTFETDGRFEGYAICTSLKDEWEYGEDWVGMNEYFYAAHKDSEIAKLNGLAPKKSDTQGDIYVMVGDPKDWCNNQPMGPFTSETKARKAIRDDCQSSLESDDELKLGSHESYFEQYTIVKIVKSFQPVAKVKADITLKNL